MAETSQFGNTRLILVRGDITRQVVDVIVNAANSSLMGGGGVDGALHLAGGPAILEECKQIRTLQGQCAPGEAVITGGGRLQARYVIHTVGPRWRGGTTNEAQILANAYRNSLALAVQYEATTIAFPSISTGAYGYPLEEAAKIALTTVKQFCETDNSFNSLQEIRFVLFDKFTEDAYMSALDEV